MKQYDKLPASFYTGSDVIAIAQQLVGTVLVTNLDGLLTAGRIVETEAYCGRNDRACHAFNRRTSRTETMYAAGGRAYVYLCYGLHHLFNIVTNREGLADAVLVRAVEPLEGLDLIMERRKTTRITGTTNGPGKLAQGLGIHRQHDGELLTGHQIWIGFEQEAPAFQLDSDVRIGVDYAGEDALLPWRFFMRDNPWVSVKKKSPA